MGWEQYAATWATQYGGYDLRRAPAAARGWLRLGYGVARMLAPMRVRSPAVTLVGVGLAVAVPLVAGRSSTGPLVAGGLALLSAFAGTVARVLGVLHARIGPRAAIRDAVGDRIGEVAWLAGFWVAGVPGPLVVATGVATGLHAYVHEQALAAGMSRVGAETAGGRTARAVVAVTGFGLAGLTAAIQTPATAGVLTVAAAVWLLLTLAGLGQLAGAVRRSLP